MEEKGICFPEGFKASGIRCGIKEKNKDLALIYSQVPCVATGLFTTNKFKAAPVLLDIKRLRKGKAQAIIINSGNANALTGEEGLKHVMRISSSLASILGIEEELILVASTGVIGVPLPVEKIEKILPELVKRLSFQGNKEAAEAIMTTDTFPKEASLDTGIPGRGKKTVKLGGMVKGAGMISPQLATLLAFITTDACISLEALREALRKAVEESFHRVLVDGDMSTNDTVIILANGLARNRRIQQDRPEWEEFTQKLTLLCQKLSQQVARDGEGASKFIIIKVKGAWDRKDAHRVGRAVARSPLVKTALYGENPNWGRIISAIGGARAKFKPHQVTLSIQGIKIFEEGEPLWEREALLREALKKKEIVIEIDLHHGPHQTTLWTCDLTEEYIKINAHYRT